MSQAHKKVVLLVEDEPHILSLLSDYLAGEGYKVLEAADAPRAFEILATKPQLDLLVTDFRLPGGVSGVMIAEPALKLRPDLKVIFISGYPIEIHESGRRLQRDRGHAAGDVDADLALDGDGLQRDRALRADSGQAVLTGLFAQPDSAAAGLTQGTTPPNATSPH